MNLYGDEMYNKAVEIAKNAPQKQRPRDGVTLSIPDQLIIVLDENGGIH